MPSIIIKARRRQKWKETCWEMLLVSVGNSLKKFCYTEKQRNETSGLQESGNYNISHKATFHIFWRLTMCRCWVKCFQCIISTTIGIYIIYVYILIYLLTTGPYCLPWLVGKRILEGYIIPLTEDESNIEELKRKRTWLEESSWVIQTMKSKDFFEKDKWGKIY